MSLYFSQQHLFTQFGHTVPVESTPHFEFLKGNTEAYKAYLLMSWQYYIPGHTPAQIEKRVRTYAGLVEAVRHDGVQTPVVVFKRPNGDTMIFDGNHRAAICSFYDLPLPKRQMQLVDVIAHFTKVAAQRFGAPKGVPYQSIYAPDGALILKGRRTDLKDRANLIDPADIVNKKVIDVGCNYGNALMLTHGAASLTGTDTDPDLLTAAVRLAVIFQKQIDYKVWDMNTKPVYLDQFDTAFIFSVDAHLETLAGLVYFIENKVKNVVYYETHAGHALPEKIRKLFSSVQQVGLLGERHIYRCAK